MKSEKLSRVLHSVEAYYSEKIHTHGPVAQGVDWKDESSQRLRFTQLLEVLPREGFFTLNDIGCGYGLLAQHLDSLNRPHTYRGCDISEPMIEAARQKTNGRAHTEFYASTQATPVSEYSVASGIFNVRLEHDTNAWESYIKTTIQELNRISTKGFAFNMLTSYSDADRMRPDLYYANPAQYFDLCMRQYSRHVRLLHDYGLYEFTLVVRKQL